MSGAFSRPPIIHDFFVFLKSFSGFFRGNPQTSEKICHGLRPLLSCGIISVQRQLNRARHNGVFRDSVAGGTLILEMRA